MSAYAADRRRAGTWTRVFSAVAGASSDACVAIDLCAPFNSVAWLTPIGVSTPHLAISSRHGEAFVPKDFPVQESRDERMHVCLRYDPFGDLEVTCLFVPNRIF
jgi:hypothetical protein